MCSESDAGNVLSGLTASLNRLTAFQSQPAALAEAVNLLSSAQIQVEEAVGELNRFIDNFDADPNRLQMLEERLDTIYSLARKHRVQPGEAALRPRVRGVRHLEERGLHRAQLHEARAHLDRLHAIEDGNGGEKEPEHAGSLAVGAPALAEADGARGCRSDTTTGLGLQDSAPPGTMAAGSIPIARSDDSHTSSGSRSSTRMGSAWPRIHAPSAISRSSWPGPQPA